MKKTLALIFFVGTTALTSAQQLNPAPHEQGVEPITSGTLLIQSANRRDAALWSLLIGAAFSTYYFTVLENPNPPVVAAPLVIGTVLHISLCFSANDKERKAGQQLDNTGL